MLTMNTINNIKTNIKTHFLIKLIIKRNLPRSICIVVKILYICSFFFSFKEE